MTSEALTYQSETKSCYSQCQNENVLSCHLNCSQVNSRHREGALANAGKTRHHSMVWVMGSTPATTQCVVTLGKLFTSMCLCRLITGKYTNTQCVSSHSGISQCLAEGYRKEDQCHPVGHVAREDLYFYLTDSCHCV